MAWFLAVLRVIGDKEETSFTRILLEGAICGALSLCAGHGLAQLGFGQNWYLFCGGMIGFMGSQTIRAWAKRWVGKKIN